MDEVVFLGTDIESNQQIQLRQRDRSAGTYMIGRAGTGKTSLLLNLMLQDAVQGRGFCFVDPHGDATDDFLSRLPPNRSDRVVLVDIANREGIVGLNFYELRNPDDEVERARRAEQAVDVIRKLFEAKDFDSGWGVQIDEYLLMSSHVLVSNPGNTVIDIPLLLTNQGFRTTLLGQVTDPYVRSFWEAYDSRPRYGLDSQQSQISPLLRRLHELMTNPLVRRIVGQSRTTINVRTAMDTNQIVLVRLAVDQIGDRAVNVLGSIVVGMVLDAAVSRRDTVLRRPFGLYADEYQRFATKAFATLLDEARKYGVYTTLAHQGRSQLDEINKGVTLRAANMVVFGVSGEDAEELKTSFNAKRQQEVVGEQPKRVPSTQPFQDLCQHPHEDPMVRVSVTTFLIPLRDNARLYDQLPQGKVFELTHPWYKGYRYGVQRDSLSRGIALIDAYLRAMMSTHMHLATHKEAGSLTAIATALRGYIGIISEKRPLELIGDRTDSTGRYEITGMRLIDQDLDRAQEQALAQLIEHLVATYQLEPPSGNQPFPATPLEHALDAWWQGQAAHECRNLLWRVENARSDQKLHEEQLYYGVASAGFLGEDHENRRDGIYQDRWKLQAAWQARPLEERLDEIRVAIHHAEALHEGMREAEAFKVAEAFAERFWSGVMPRSSYRTWCRNLLQWLRMLMDLGRRLAAQPIMVAGNEMEPIVRDRPIADIRNELANTLATLPNWTAYCKIAVTQEGATRREEYMMTTAPLSPPMTSAIEAITDIGARNRAIGYCRSPEVIDDEIRGRQNDWHKSASDETSLVSDEPPPFGED